MKQKKILLLVLLAILIGLPILGVLQGVIYRTQLKQMLTPNMGGAEMSSDGSVGRPTAAEPASMAIAPDQDLRMEKPYILPNQNDFAPGAERVIVKNADLSLVVNDIRKSVDEIASITKNSDGYVTSANIFQNSYAVQSGDSYLESDALSANMTLRIPTDKLDGVLTQLRALSVKILQDNVTASDQTKQKVDLEAQLKNLRATETQLQAIMRQAETVQETLAVQQQLSSVRSQIEIFEADLQNLSNNAAMSSVSVSLTTKESDQPTISAQQNSIVDELKLAFKDMIRLYRNLLIAGVRLAILALPVLVIGVIAWFAWQRFARKS